MRIILLDSFDLFSLLVRLPINLAGSVAQSVGQAGLAGLPAGLGWPGLSGCLISGTCRCSFYSEGCLGLWAGLAGSVT